jgi:hypothetical protein
LWGWIILLGAIIVVVMVAHALGWIDFSDKSRRGGTGPGVLGMGDEVFHPTRHEAQVELDRQTILPAPAPLPGDGDLGIAGAPGSAPEYSGRVKIDVSTDR